MALDRNDTKGQQIKSQPMIQASYMDTGSHPGSCLSEPAPWESSSDGPSDCAHAKHMGDLARVPSFWQPPGEWTSGYYSLLSLSLCPSLCSSTFKQNKSLRKKAWKRSVLLSKRPVSSTLGNCGIHQHLRNINAYSIVIYIYNIQRYGFHALINNISDR